jgi:hypothetical protein
MAVLARYANEWRLYRLASSRHAAGCVLKGRQGIPWTSSQLRSIKRATAAAFDSCNQSMTNASNMAVN